MYLFNLEENLPLVFGPKPFALLLPRLLLGLLVPREEAIEGHLDDCLLGIIPVRDVAIFVAKDPHGIVEALGVRDLRRSAAVVFMAMASESVGKGIWSLLMTSRRVMPSGMYRVYVYGISTRVMRRRNDNLDLRLCRR